MSDPVPVDLPDARVRCFEGVEETLDALEESFAGALARLRGALQRYLAHGHLPSTHERTGFVYPQLEVQYFPKGAPPRLSRAYGTLTQPGIYRSTVTQPGGFRAYLGDQLAALKERYQDDVRFAVRPGREEIPYAFVLDDLPGGAEADPAELARHFPWVRLAQVRDRVVDGEGPLDPEGPFDLALFDATRTDYALKRLVHYTGTPWAHVQPWLLFTNYHRYVNEFTRWAIERLHAEPDRWTGLSCAGQLLITRESANPLDMIEQAPWRRHQMPAWHLMAADGQGVSLVNIGVGPSNAKTITDHLAVLRPHCWLMIGHCGGLSHSQTIGDYVLAHAYLRRDHVLDEQVPPEIPIPSIAEVQIALQDAAARVTGDSGDALKARLRTGTVVTYDDRNWELRHREERQRISLSRAVAVDMESATIATQGFRYRVPYGTLLCVSDKPLHGEIKLPGGASRFYERAISEHLRIGLETLEALRGNVRNLHSRKLRAFDDPPFR